MTDELATTTTTTTATPDAPQSYPAPELEPEVEQILVELPDHKNEPYDGTVPVCFLTGEAGTGKTYTVRQHIQRDPDFGCLAATTGIAAINLGPGVPTIHSLLGFGNTQGAEDAYTSGNMQRKLRMVADQGYRWIIVDEASMLHYKVLDLMYQALVDHNETFGHQQALGLMLTGDMCQLPPVADKLIGPGGKVVLSSKGKEVSEPTPWLFKAECWSEFEQNTIRLTEIKRQSDETFIAALNHARAGRGKEAVALLRQAGATFRLLGDAKFDGANIVATNDEVDRINNAALLHVTGDKFQLTSERWCAKSYEPGEWRNIPDKLTLKIGALVMILQNDQSRVRQYVNGDLGHITGIERYPEGHDKAGQVLAVEVELKRNKQKVFITKITRPTYQLNEPELDMIPPSPSKDKIRRGVVPGMRRPVWIMGELEYFPLRLAYATTVHKSQGLSLTAVQIQPQAYFFGAPQMAYVALSRCRTADGLLLVGSEAKWIEKIKSDPILERWM